MKKFKNVEIEDVVKTLGILALIVLMLVFAPSFFKKHKENLKQRAEIHQTAINACVDNGGAPVFSGWNGNLKNCLYLGNK